MRLAALAVMAAGAGCGMHLRPEPVGIESNIAGHWQLQTPQRAVLVNGLRTVMEQARAKQDMRERLDARHRPEPEVRLTPPDADADADTSDPAHPGRGPRHNDWEAREHIEQQEALLNAVLPSDELQVVQSATQIELIPSTGGRRRFDMGVTSTLVTHYATLHVESGWQANVFVVHSRDSEQKINIVERYQRLGDRLHMQVQMSIPDAKDQLFTADYVHAQP
jgi:hypothetical protein